MRFSFRSVKNSSCCWYTVRVCRFNTARAGRALRISPALFPLPTHSLLLRNWPLQQHRIPPPLFFTTADATLSGYHDHSSSGRRPHAISQFLPSGSALFSLFEHEVAVVFLGGEAVGAHLWPPQIAGFPKISEQRRPSSHRHNAHKQYRTRP